VKPPDKSQLVALLSFYTEAIIHEDESIIRKMYLEDRVRELEQKINDYYKT
jgi:hypothetical protein